MPQKISLMRVCLPLVFKSHVCTLLHTGSPAGETDGSIVHDGTEWLPRAICVVAVEEKNMQCKQRREHPAYEGKRVCAAANTAVYEAVGSRLIRTHPSLPVGRGGGVYVLILI